MNSIRFVERPNPLAPRGAFAEGASARALVTKLLSRTATNGLSGVSGNGFVVIVGDEIPFTTGVTWLGREPLAPALYVPTRKALLPDPVLVARALSKQRAQLRSPLVLVPRSERILVISLALATPLGEREMCAFLAAQGE